MAASGILDAVIEKLVSGISEEFALLWGVKNDLKRLESTLSTIKSVLEDAEEKGINQKPLRDWLTKLKDAAYDADDLLNEFYMEAEHRKLVIPRQMIKKVLHFFSLSNPLVFRLKMAHKVKNITERLNEIADERTKFHLQAKDTQHRRMEISNRETMSEIDELQVYGRDEDKEAIVRFLLETDTEENVSILPIVGMGGLGKTTLAQLVYNDTRVKGEHFNKKLWVYVSEDFDLRKICGKAVEAATNKKCDLETLEVIRSHLDRELSGKRFLVVLDDLWEEDEGRLEGLKNILKNGARGSKIIVTTRQETVALKIGTTSPYKLKVLSEDDGWTLFKRRAFAGGAEDPNLVPIGRELVRKCGGVPLAVKALGSMMRFKEGQEDWEAVRDSNIWKQYDEGARVMASLRLSYTYLPSQLKQCFAYCSIFPKGHEIDKDVLIARWSAQGFLASSNRSAQVEDMGNDYFKGLLWSSFLQDMREDKYSGRVTCKMHDLMHDLSQSVTSEEVSIITEVSKGLPKHCRYVCFLDNCSRPEVPAETLKKLRELYFHSTDPTDLQLSAQTPNQIFSRARCLRTLCIGHVLLPSSIKKLKNLRYLHVSCLQRNLPESLCSLQNLQTLCLSYCDDLETLPACIGSLQNLRILILSNCPNLESLPESTGNLVNLRTLGLGFCHSLKALPNSVPNLRNLQKLDLSHCTSLQTLQPESFSGFQKLQALNLRGCTSLQALPESIGSLHMLKYLDASSCAQLEGLPDSISGLQNLQSLFLYACEKLGRLPESIGNLRNLRHLAISNCGIRGMPRRMGQLTNLRTLSYFVVGEEEVKGEHSSSNRYSSIGEMEHLNLLEGSLRIMHLENVNSPSDAKRANLKEKPNLQELTLSWRSSSGLAASEPEEGKEEAALECLQPHPNIHYLYLQGYGGAKLPHWMGASSLQNLSHLELHDIQNCEHLPPLGQLPSLVSLQIGRMPGVKQVGLEFYGDHLRTSFPSLTELSFHDMPNLEEWLTSTAAVEDGGAGDRVSEFPRLNQLTITDCPKLRVKPCLPATIQRLEINRSNEELLSEETLQVRRPSTTAAISPPSSLLRELEISHCGASSGWKGLQCLTALTDLRICGCNELSCLPESIGCLISLQELQIDSCPMLSTLPECIGELTSLDTLSIEDCARLIALPEGLKHLTALTDLCIRGCNELSCLPESIGCLISLRELQIDSCPMLSTLPECIGELTSLDTLSIEDCACLIALPEGLKHLTALTDLRICACDELSCLPESIGCLISLQELQIDSCPMLSTLPECIGELTSLHTLSIEDCACLIALPEGLKHLTALTDLRICGCNELSCLPESIGCLISLRELQIDSCPMLSTLPECIGELTSLHTLSIEDCPSLTVLPKGLKHLTNLRYLKIKDASPTLAERCQRKRGKDWHKIAHIPMVDITLRRQNVST